MSQFEDGKVRDFLIRFNDGTELSIKAQSIETPTSQVKRFVLKTNGEIVAEYSKEYVSGWRVI